MWSSARDAVELAYGAASSGSGEDEQSSNNNRPLSRPEDTVPSTPLAFLLHNVTTHEPTDQYARNLGENDIRLLQRYVAGQFMGLQGNVPGSDFAADAETAGAAEATDLARLQQLVEEAPRFSLGSEPGVLWRGALVDANVARRKRPRDIAMPHAFSCSRRRDVAIDWAKDQDEPPPKDLAWAVFRIEVPPETPALRISQSAVLYEHPLFQWQQDALIRQREVMLPPGELTDVAWMKTDRGLRFISCTFRRRPSQNS